MLKNFEKVFQHFFISLKKYVIYVLSFFMSLYSLQNNHTTGGTWRKYGVAAKRLQIKKRLISANSSEYAHGAGALLTLC